VFRPLQAHYQGGTCKGVQVQRGRDSLVGIAIRYGLGGSGIEFRWGEEILRSRQDRPWIHTASYSIDSGPFPEVKRPGRGVEDEPTPSSFEVRERLELFLYSPSEPS